MRDDIELPVGTEIVYCGPKPPGYAPRYPYAKVLDVKLRSERFVWVDFGSPESRLPVRREHVRPREKLTRGVMPVTTTGREEEMKKFSDLSDAMRAARERTGDEHLGHSVHAGEFRLNRVTYGPRGTSTVEHLTDPAPFEEHLRRVRAWGQEEA